MIMFQVPSPRIVSAIALLLVVLGQLIASASCNSAAQKTEGAQIVGAAELDDDSNHIDRTQDSTQHLRELGQETSSKFKLVNFEAFQERFNKHYATLLERVFRLRQFIASLARVSRSTFAYLHHKSAYFLRINRYSDLTRDERRNKFGQRPDSEVELSKFGHADNSNDEKVLSRRKRWLFGGREGAKKLEYEAKCLNEPDIVQGECGCCYAMAMMRLFEWLHCKQHGNPIKLSEQYLVDCGLEHGLQGCQEGTLLKTLAFITAKGVMRAEEFPYVGEQQTCPSDVHQRAIRVKKVVWRTIRERKKWPSELKKAPLVVWLSLPDDFYDYGGGLLEWHNCEELGHFMLLVGHGLDPNHNKRPFFLFSNSFGLDYGESGYLRLAADRMEPDCLAYAISVEAAF